MNENSRHKSFYFGLMIIVILTINIYSNFQYLRDLNNFNDKDASSIRSNTITTIYEWTPYGSVMASAPATIRGENDYFEWSIITLYGPGFTWYMMNDTEFWALIALPQPARTRGSFSYTALLSDEEELASGTFYPQYADTWWFVSINHYTGYNCSVEFISFWYDDFLTVSEPDSSSLWALNTSQYINWTWGGDFAFVDIDLYHNDTFLTNIATSVQNNGSYLWNIPNTISMFDDLYQINISNSDYSETWDNSDYFEIYERNNPIITNSPSDFNVEYGYSGVIISWIATDQNPNIYTIELQGTGIVAGPSTWLNGSLITYNVPDGLNLGIYTYTINLTDDYGNFITDTVLMSVIELEDPIITIAPTDFSVEYGYSGIILSWTATDQNPNIYTITLEGIGIVAGPTVWSNNTAITFNVPDGSAVGQYIYTVNFTDDYNNFITDAVIMTVEDTIDPIVTNAPSDFSVNQGYTGVNISWTATDPHPSTYTIELEGSGIIEGPTAWLSGVAITYFVPEGLAAGQYSYTVNFTDQYGNSITHTVTLTVASPGGISPELIVIISSVVGGGLVIGISIVLIMRRKRKLT
ncbi:MAG: hypothetical protein ACFE8E_12725 [Candidatus Hodarchaeota archaeon]